LSAFCYRNAFFGEFGWEQHGEIGLTAAGAEHGIPRVAVFGDIGHILVIVLTTTGSSYRCTVLSG